MAPIKLYYLSAEVAPFSETYELASFSRKITSKLHDKEDIDIRVSQPKYGYVSERKYILREVIRLKDIPVIFNEEKRNQFLMSFKALRPHQWIKNLLLFVPLLAAHKYDSVDLIASTLIAFICFCFIASCAYLLNDLIDLENDRHHFQKKYRPFANGSLSLVYGWVLIPSLFITRTSMPSPLAESLLIAERIDFTARLIASIS